MSEHKVSVEQAVPTSRWIALCSECGTLGAPTSKDEAEAVAQVHRDGDDKP
jgi:hypothetical protein